MKLNIMKKAALAAVFAFGLLLANASPAFAAKETITNVTLSINTSAIYTGSTTKNIEVYSDNDSYRVSNDKGTATNYPEAGWKTSSTPRFEITLKAESGYRFDTNSLRNNTYYTFSGDKVNFVKASGTATSITLTVNMDKLTDDGNDSSLNVTDLSWDEDTGIASWAENGASRYSVKLYHGSQLVFSDETSNTEYDFASKISSTGNYKFRVRAFDGSSVGKWEESENFRVTNERLNTIKARTNSPANSSTAKGAWLKDNVGWWYCNADRSYSVNNWQLIDGKWYFFNERGYMVTGWVLWKNIWYYCSSNGDMLVNTRTPDGYRVDANGAWVQ